MSLWAPDLERRFLATLAPLLDQYATHVADLPASAEAWLLWELARASRQPVLWIADGPRTLELVYRDLLTLAPPDAPPLLQLPSWEKLPGDKAARPDPETLGMRLATLLALPAGGPFLIATCIQALMEHTLTVTSMGAHTLQLAPGDEADPAALAARLTRSGYAFDAEVMNRGDAALRGGILDAWPFTSRWPFRFEFSGTTLESIRTFDPAEQQSITRVDRASLPPAGEWPLLKGNPATGIAPAALMPDPLIVVWSDIVAIRSRAEVYESSVRDLHAEAITCTGAEVETAFRMRTTSRSVYVGSRPDAAMPTLELDVLPVEAVPRTRGRHGLHPDAIETARGRFLSTAASQARAGQTVLLYLDSTGTQDRFRESYAEVFRGTSIETTIASLSSGFTSRSLALTVIAEPDLYGRKIQRRRPAQDRVNAGARVSDWTDMEPGNLVVHVEHGVGRYLGLREITFNNRLQEALAIEYAEGAKLYVPVSQAHLLTRYVGAGRRSAALHQLGGKRWAREKLAAEKAVQDLSSTLLEVQASRDSQEGFAFPPDVPWQHELEAAFPYQETDDQNQAIQAVKGDMETRRPMDRLLCGDAGYGKTEVAVRAAFKAVMTAKQVAVLVPTTVLAQQHYQTFTERMAPFPVRVEMLSRFRTRGECDEVVEGLREGTVDIVIGTHALLQPDIVFRDLGLVIIDEEQRFGVLHKERFKHIRRLVDVLTLTATPIPRTLYMSMTGARDLSTIQTPPQDRQDVETIVTPATDSVIREAVLRELNREGQVFYLHNRVRTIERVRDRLRQLVPEARIEIGHGQMSAGALSEIMRAFAANEFDVLLCTTIIESGLDVPNANTILIDRADRFGLAELYQLRGRVGRSKHQSYAYMLLPTQAHVDPTARKRIQAIRQYSGAGAGFRLAMRDLEIRGAGNLLGSEQSGHIAAVGFGLYCQLLRRTVAQARGETLPPVIDVETILDFISLSPADAGAAHAALIPFTYIEDERLRVSMYRRVAEAAYAKEIRALRRTFRDRFGPLPPECDRLLKLAELRVLAASQGFQSIEVEAGKVMLKRRGNYLMLPGGKFPRLKSGHPDAQLDELLAMLKHPDK